MSVWRIRFDFPFDQEQSIKSQLFFKTIISRGIRQLEKDTIKYLVENKLEVFFDKITDCYGFQESITGFKDTIHLDSKLRIIDFPAVWLHECFHGIFPQLCEREVKRLERWAIRRCSLKFINKIVGLLFTKQWKMLKFNRGLSKE